MLGVSSRTRREHMIIGVPRERKTLEKRVALTPDGAAELIQAGHRVLIEEGAGMGSFFSDSSYASAGCEVTHSLKDLWQRSQLVIKVKEPHEEEYQYFRPGLLLFDYLHLAGLPEVATALLQAKVTGIAYELVSTPDGRLPLLEPMSEIAGKLSVLNGASALLSQHGGRGLLLGGAIGVAPAHVTILGAGIAGRAACEVALGMGATVSVLDIDMVKLDRIKVQFQGRAITLFSTQKSVERACAEADLVIGAVLIPGAAAPKLISRSMVKGMKPGSVIVDISVDQGGCCETIRTTSLKDPVYTEEGVIHYGVPNMPAQTPRTSTLALTAATLPYIKRLAKLGHDFVEQDAALREAVSTYNGEITNKAVAQSLSLPFKQI
jgi:alanine dehydrogenase